MKIPDWKWILKWRVIYPVTHGHSYTKYYERAVRDAMFSMSGATFWDVGANTGYYTIPLAEKFDEVTAIEPDPVALEFLRQKIAKANLNNVRVLPVALSDSVGSSKLYTPTKVRRSSIGSVNSLIVPNEPSSKASPAQPAGVPLVEVQTDTIDHVLGERTIDLLKIDVEGAEFMVLKGGTNALHEMRIKNMMIELHDWKRKSELDQLLSTNQYNVNWLDFAAEAATSHVLATAARRPLPPESTQP